MAFSLSDDTTSRYSNVSATTKLHRIEKQSQKMMQEVIDTTAVLGTAGLLAWYQGRSGGQMTKIGPISLDLLVGLAAKGVGLYSELSETRPLKTDEVDWGETLSRAGDGALAWFVGNYLLAVGKRQHDEAVAPAVVTPGWNHMFGQGTHIDMGAAQGAFAGYR